MNDPETPDTPADDQPIDLEIHDVTQDSEGGLDAQVG